MCGQTNPVRSPKPGRLPTFRLLPWGNPANGGGRRKAAPAVLCVTMGPVILAVISVVLVILGTVEFVLHRRNLRAIPIRIHVNGTRGKSSVTRLIAAGLREAGIVTCAKTTGTLARMIMPDGQEYPVFRPSKPNVIEQVRIVATARKAGAQALVLECMAVHPMLQSLSEFRLINATHGVITNARADHLDVMGPTETDVAWALCGMTPVKGALFTAERRHLGILEQAARDRGSTVSAISGDDVDAVTDSEMAGFSYVEHKENVALALRVCESAGVDRATGLRGMQKTRPDPGAMTVHELQFFGRRIVFINAFAANDPESTGRLWRMALERYPEVETRIAVFNCRADRADRSRQLGEACAQWPEADHYLLIGSGTYVFAREAIRHGLPDLKMVFGEDQRVDEIFETVVGLSGQSSVVMGMGNIGNQGLDIVQYFRNRSSFVESF
ncbi:MAG: hypothetical protein GMKNLPBB_03028 [Myxococcota bacterium]|nr:hypothetical protein [Myxococcota bacterium]